MVDEGVDLFRFIGVNHQTRALVQQQEILVLVHDVKSGLKQGEEHIFFLWLVKKLIVDIKLQYISLLQPLVPLSPPAVDLDAL